MADKPDLFVIHNHTDHMRDRLEPHFNLIYEAEMDDPKGWAQQNGRGIRFVATNGFVGFDSAYFELFPDLALISSNAVGYDNIPVAEAVKRGIIVCHTPDVLNAEVATTALMLMLACFRNFEADSTFLREGRWPTEGMAPLSRSADNRRIGILGLGRIGMAIAHKLEPFSPTLLYHTRTKRDVPFEYCVSAVDLAEKSEVMIVITPGGAGTYHLVNAEVMEALGPNGMLVNVARGSVVDEAALVKTLQSGKLGYAALDVFEHEPEVPPELLNMPNVVMLPHVGSATHETRQAMADLTYDNLIDYVTKGSVRTPVPECAGYAPV